jgi:hypothetical protein
VQSVFVDRLLALARDLGCPEAVTATGGMAPAGLADALAGMLASAAAGPVETLRAWAAEQIRGLHARVDSIPGGVAEAVAKIDSVAARVAALGDLERLATLAAEVTAKAGARLPVLAAAARSPAAVVFPLSSLVAVDGSVMTNLNFADNSIVTFTATGTNVTADIQDNSITTNKIDSTFMSVLSAFRGKATWKAEPNTVGSEVSSLTTKGIVSTVLFSQSTSGGGCTTYDEYEIQFSSNIGTDYTPVVILEGDRSGIDPAGGIVQNGDGSSSISGTGFKVWRVHGVDEPCLSDGYRITVLISNY